MQVQGWRLGVCLVRRLSVSKPPLSSRWCSFLWVARVMLFFFILPCGGVSLCSNLETPGVWTVQELKH